MVRILAHVLILPAMLWLDRRSVKKLPPLHAAVIWYLLGVPLMLIEALATGNDRIPVLLQSVLTALFFLPPAYFGFRYAARRGGILKPFLLYLALSVIAGFVVALTLARTSEVLGSVWKS